MPTWLEVLGELMGTDSFDDGRRSTTLIQAQCRRYQVFGELRRGACHLQRDLTV